MTSEHVSELLSSYIDGELAGEQLTAVERHLEQCPQCRQELSELQATVQLVHSLPELELPSGFREELRQRLLVESLGNTPGAPDRARSNWSSGLVRWVRSVSRGRAAWVAAAAVVIVALVVAANSSLFAPGRLGDVASDQGLRHSYGLSGQGAPGAATPPVATAPPEPSTTGVMGESSKSADFAPAVQPQGSTAQDTSGQATGSPQFQVQQSNSNLFDRKVIRTGQFDIEVEDAAKAYQSILVLAEGVGGFVQESSQRADGDRMTANLVIRVPDTSFGRVLDEINSLGTIKNQHMGGQDVTEEYVDLQSRIKTLQAKESRLLDILGQANTIDDVLKVENQLWSVRDQIEQQQGRLRYLDNMTSLATLQINLYEPQPVPPDQQPDTLIDQLLKALVNSVKYLGYYAGKLLIAVTWVLPYVALLGVIWLVARQFASRRRPPSAGS